MQNDLISKIEVLNIIHEKYMKFRIESQTPMGEDNVLIDDTKESIAIVLKALHDDVKNLKTAYDVENVCEQLKETSKIYCEEYHQREGSLYIQDVVEIVRYGGEKYKTKTNADRIRVMTDEQLADILVYYSQGVWCTNVTNGRYWQFEENAIKSIIEFLQSEVEEE